MNIIGKIMEVAVDVDVPKNGGGSYKGTRITYRDVEGSLKEQALHSNALKYNPALKAAIAALKPGDDFTMVKEKEGEFWNVKSIVVGVVQQTSAPSAGGGTKGTGSTASPRSTYETPEERAKKQVYIVRQSSITSAISLIAATTKKGSVNDVLSMAKQFEAFVFDQEFDDGTIENMPNDEID